MSDDLCPGCGRTIDDDSVACRGCGRPLSRGTAIPPGWNIAAGTTAVAAAPRWRVAGIGTALPATADEEPSRPPVGELFRPSLPAPDEAADAESLEPGGPGWRIRARPSFVRDHPPPPPPVQPASRGTGRRLIYWGLVGGILASSSSAVLLLAAHLMRIH